MVTAPARRCAHKSHARARQQTRETRRRDQRPHQYALPLPLSTTPLTTPVRTALVTLTFLVIYYACAEPYFVCPATFLAKVYSNSLLAVFNSRIRILGGREWDAAVAADVHLSLATGCAGGAMGHALACAPPSSADTLGSVRVREDVWVHRDGIEMKDRVSGVDFWAATGGC